MSKEIAKDCIESGPKKRAERIVSEKGRAAGSLHAGERRGNAIQSGDELRDDQRAQPPLLEASVRSFCTIARVTAEDTKYAEDAAAPATASFKPDEVTSEASEDAN